MELTQGIAILLDRYILLTLVPSYELFKETLLANGAQNDARLHSVASFATSVVVCAVMNPFDVAMTRMVSSSDSVQPKDCRIQ